MKKNIFILLSLCIVMFSCQKDDEPLNQKDKEPYVYTVKEMGALSTMLTPTQKDTITTMIVRGEINKADFEVMNKEMPNLQHIDLSAVKCEDDKIPDDAFSGNKTIISFVFPKGVTSIGIRAFNSCAGLTGSLTLPESVTKIENYAFFNCSSFDGSLTLPKNLLMIGYGAFYNCSSFTGSLHLPQWLTIIEAHAFLNCSGFNGSLTLPDKLIAIETGAFQNCSGFTGTLQLPQWLTRVESQVFRGCSGFTELELGINLKRIGHSAFKDCENIRGKVIFPINLSLIREFAFDECPIDAFQFPHSTPPPYFTDMLPNGATVKVPTEVVDVYKATVGWKEHAIVGY